jgi:hypothetical protein
MQHEYKPMHYERTASPVPAPGLAVKLSVSHCLKLGFSKGHGPLTILK